MSTKVKTSKGRAELSRMKPRRGRTGRKQWGCQGGLVAGRVKEQKNRIPHIMQNSLLKPVEGPEEGGLKKD